MATKTHLATAGLQGWRAKVGDTVAPPVAKRTPASEEQIRAIPGVGPGEHVDHHLRIGDGAGDLDPAGQEVGGQGSDPPVAGRRSGWGVGGDAPRVPFVLTSFPGGEELLPLRLEAGVEPGDEGERLGVEDPERALRPARRLDLDRRIPNERRPFVHLHRLLPARRCSAAPAPTGGPSYHKRRFLASESSLLYNVSRSGLFFR